MLRVYSLTLREDALRWRLLLGVRLPPFSFAALHPVLATLHPARAPAAFPQALAASFAVPTFVLRWPAPSLPIAPDGIFLRAHLRLRGPRSRSVRRATRGLSPLGAAIAVAQDGEPQRRAGPLP